MVQEELKMPDDLEGEDYDHYDMDQDGFVEEEAEEELEEDGLAPQESEEDMENDVFAMARENKELNFANQEMLDRIEKIEDDMMGGKSW